MTGGDKMELNCAKMDPKVLSYKIAVIENGFDINAGQDIDFNMTLEETVNYVSEFVDKRRKGCCFHASIFLMKLLHLIGLESELILTLEPTKLENGEVRIDKRASILLNDGGKYIVMNPIEDIEYFEEKGIFGGKRENEYIGGTTQLNGDKKGIHSKDGGNIPLEDFIQRYGHGTAWTVGSLFRPEFQTMTLDQLMNRAKIIDLKEYTENDQNIK